MNEYRNGALYIRVSTDKQEELSPDAQRRLLLDYAKSNNIFIDPALIFQDNGVSGRKAEKRPEFMRMIATAKSSDHPIDVILVWKFSRFARNQEEAIVYKQALKCQHSVDVVSITEPIIDGVFGSLIERIIEWMDEYYSINLSQEVIRGMTENAMRGGYQATPCLGYRSEVKGEPFVIVPEEAKLVRFIFDSYVSGKDGTAISRHLNMSGYRLKRGGMFEKRKIDYIIRNKFYIGKLVWNGIETDGRHETFISKELFEKANEKLESKVRKLKRRNVSTCKHWLSGVLLCGTCGASLSINISSPAPYFQCWKYAKGYHPDSCSITSKRAEEYVISFFENAINGGSFEYEAISRKPDLDEAAMIQRELDKLTAREQRVRNAYEAGIDSLEEYKDARERIRSERAELEKMLTAAHVPIDKDALIEKMRSVYNALISDDVDFIEKGQMLRSIVDSISYDKHANTMRFKMIL